MKQQVKIGVVCLARKTFDYQAAEVIYQGIKKELQLIEYTDFVFINELVIEVEDARHAAQKLVQSQPDGLIVISGTFHLGHLVLELNKVIEQPLLLWGLNELPYDGGKIRLNSVCGVNLNASNLYKAGVRGYHYTIGDTVDQDWLDAIRVMAAWRDAKIGLAGYRAHGFFNLAIDELNAYRQLGFLVDHFELEELYSYVVAQKAIDEKREKIKSIFDTGGLSELQLQKVAELSAKLDNFINQHNLTALALRCWPEFAAKFGISPCAALSLLQSEEQIISCEGDVEGAVSMLAHRAVGAETPFLADLSQVDFEEDYALLWHCGVAPCNLWDGSCKLALDSYFADGKGVTADFVMKSGPVSILRLDSAGGQHRLFLQQGEAVAMEKALKGSYARVNFERPVREVLQLVITKGIAHHVSMVYGDFIKPFEILARIKGWTVLK